MKRMLIFGLALGLSGPASAELVHTCRVEATDFITKPVSPKRHTIWTDGKLRFRREAVGRDDEPLRIVDGKYAWLLSKPARTGYRSSGPGGGFEVVDSMRRDTIRPSQEMRRRGGKFVGTVGLGGDRCELYERMETGIRMRTWVSTHSGFARRIELTGTIKIGSESIGIHSREDFKNWRKVDVPVLLFAPDAGYRITDADALKRRKR